MRNAYGPRRLKWALEWPMAIPDLPSVNDGGGVPVSISNLKMELTVLGGATACLLVLVTVHWIFGF